MYIAEQLSFRKWTLNVVHIAWTEPGQMIIFIRQQLVATINTNETW